MKLTDEQRAAYQAANERWVLEGGGLETIFATGIAHAQAWRSIASAPKRESVLLLLADGSRCIGEYYAGDYETSLAAGWFDREFRINPTHWLSLPPAPKEGK